MPPPGLFQRQTAPLVNYTWKEWLEDNGIVTFNGAVLPGATKVYESFTSTRDNSESVSTTDYTAQVFTIGNTGDNEDFWLTKVWVDAPSIGNMRIEIQAVTSNEPNGTVLARFTQTGQRVSDSAGAKEWYEWSVSESDTPNLKLSASTEYALVIYRDGASSTTVGYLSTGGYGGGSKYDSADSGSNWTIDTGADLLFKIIGSTKNPFILTSSSVTSSKSTSVVTAKTDSDEFALLTTIQFEGKINKSAIIQGDAIVDATISAGAGMVAIYSIIELYHIDSDSNETKIGEGEAWTGGARVEMELTTTKVSPNDKIRLDFKLYYVEGGVTDTSTITLNHSGTNLLLHLPFKTDI